MEIHPDKGVKKYLFIIPNLFNSRTYIFLPGILSKFFWKRKDFNKQYQFFQQERTDES